MIYEFFQDIQLGRVKKLIFANSLPDVLQLIEFVKPCLRDHPLIGLIGTSICTSELSYGVNILNSLGLNRVLNRFLTKSIPIFADKTYFPAKNEQKSSFLEFFFDLKWVFRAARAYSEHFLYLR